MVVPGMPLKLASARWYVLDARRCSPGTDDGQDSEEQVPSLIRNAALPALLRERLAGEAGSEHVMLRYEA